MDLVFEEFVRKPFVVEAVLVTKQNIADIAEFIGTLELEGDRAPYIQVDSRLVPNVVRVYPGYWMTRIGDNFRCYSKKIFNDQFTLCTNNMKIGLVYFGVPVDA